MAFVCLKEHILDVFTQKLYSLILKYYLMWQSLDVEKTHLLYLLIAIMLDYLQIVDSDKVIQHF
jgi:hypothetical protein